MKLVGAISTAVLSLSLGIGIPAYASKTSTTSRKKTKTSLRRKKRRRHNRKNLRSRKRKHAGRKDAKPEEKNAQQRTIQAGTEATACPAAAFLPTATRPISDGNISFRVSEGDYRNHRFQYGGYWFGFASAWPSNWLYTQDVYVVEIDGVYYLCNASYPGVNLTLSVTL